MAQVIKQAGNVFGRIGAGLGSGLGEGLADQLPQEMNRSRLAKGLRKIGQDKSLSPFDQAAQMYSLPGGSEAAPNLIPLLRNRNTDIDYINQGDKKRSTPTFESNFSQPIKELSTDEEEGLKTFLTPNSSKILGEVILPPSVEEIQMLAREYLRTQPNRFSGDVEKAEAQAEKDLNKPYNARLAEQNSAIKQQAIKDKFDKDFANYLSTNIQKNGERAYADVEGDMLNQIRSQAENDVVSGKLSQEKAIRKYGDELLNFAREKQNLKNIGATSFINKNAKDSIRSVENIRKEFKKFGREREFNNLLQSELNLSPENAAYLAYPIKEDKELNNYIAKQKSVKDFSYGSSKFNKANTEIMKSVEGLNNVIKEDSSILAIVAAMSAKGYGKREYLKAIDDAYKNNKLKLSDSQQKELNKTIPNFPTFDDLYYLSIFGLDDLVEQK